VESCRIKNKTLRDRAAAARSDQSWNHDFAVGQVVLTNDLQRSAVSEHLTDRDISQTLLQGYANRVREYE
jgi:hypothetical protein